MPHRDASSPATPPGAASRAADVNGGRRLAGRTRCIRARALGAALALLAGLAACGDPTGDPPTDRLRIVVPPAGTAPADAQIVLAPGASAKLGAQLGGATAADVHWTSREVSIAEVSGDGTVLARALGATHVVASAGDFTDSVRVVVTACEGSSSAISLEPGQVRSFGAGEGAELCLDAAGTQAEYVLVGYAAGSSAAASVPFDVTASSTGITAAQAAALDAANAEVVAAAAASEPELLGGVGTRTRDTRLDERLRAFERTSLEPRMAALREAHRARTSAPAGGIAPSLSIAGAAPEVNDVVSLNADPDDEGDGCTAVEPRGARVVAVTNRAVVLADTLNPGGGFSTTEYRGFAAAFDTLAWPVDVQNFGEPSDIDRNGKVLIFFTAAVNEMTPAGASYYIGGFFHPRDLYPKAASRTLPACKGSNEAEMFYMLVPDPTGKINGNKFDKTFVQRITTGTLAHEFQHLINAGRRTFVNDGAQSETVWLNEGLSHVAEELLFYRTSSIAPRERVTLDAIRATQRTVDAYNAYANPNMSRLLNWLKTPESLSPFASNDELGTRGATWQFLRYVADQRDGNERDLWFALVNGRQSGLANLREALGTSELDPLFRDWAVANAADGAGVTPLDARHRFKSWDFRDVIQGVRQLDAYPLRTRTLAEGQTESLSVNSGTAGYLRLPVSAGRIAYVRTRNGSGPMPQGLRLSVVRVK